MLTHIAKRKTIGQLKGPAKNRSISMVVAFVEKHLEVFANENSGTTIKNEKGLTQRLCRLLNRFSDNCPFYFDKEDMEDEENGNSPAADIGVITRLSKGVFIHSKWYGSRNSFFKIEAKRLDVISGARKKEYLVGRWEKEKYVNSGGVERFKKGIHGRELRYCAMIGYVQQYDFDHWHRAINSWIDDFIAGENTEDTNWSENDKLTVFRKSLYVAHYRSENSRKTDSIHLFHLWVNLVE